MAVSRMADLELVVKEADPIIPLESALDIEYKGVKERIGEILKNREKVNKLRQIDLHAGDMDMHEIHVRRAEIVEQISTLHTNTKKQATEAKEFLENIKKTNNQLYAENKTSNRARTLFNKYQRHYRDFHNAMNAYLASHYEYEEGQERRKKEQLRKVVDSQNWDITDEQIDLIARSGRADDVIQEALLDDSLAGVVAEIEAVATHAHILEQQVRELYELFSDLSTIVATQKETLDNIEEHVRRAQNFTSRGREHLAAADMHQKTSRTRACILTVIGVAVALILLIIFTGTDIFSTSA